MISSKGAPGYFQLSEANKRAYATRHGYGLHILPPGDPSRHPSWSKVCACVLHEVEPECAASISTTTLPQPQACSCQHRRSSIHPNTPPSWCLQIPAALSLLPLYDWLWVVDTDTLVMTPEVPLTQYIDEEFDMVLTEDCNNINAG